jgi:hypothetical protein
VSGHENPGLLLDTLAIAVPAEIDNLRWSDGQDRLAIAPRLSVRMRSGGDDLLFGGPECARSFADLAQALALLAYQPGGVRFGPLAWCAAHPRERWPDGESICPACLREETGEGGAAP